LSEGSATVLILAASCVAAVCIYAVGKWLFGLGRTHDEDAVMDHIDVTGARNYSKKREKAQIKHGKQFRAHLNVLRVEPASHLLKELEKASREAEAARAAKEAQKPVAEPPSNVSQISQKRK
jgi:hypothetical protein